MLKDKKLKIGASCQGDCFLLPEMACRHGLVTGATGSGKTVTLKVLAEGFSQMGVPVFLVDVKGDVSSLAKPGVMNDKLAARLEEVGEADFAFRGFPVRFWDVYGDQGIPVRITVNDLGPVLLGRLMNATPAQQGVLNILFKVSDALGWELLDFKDLRAMVQHLQENRKEISESYGTVSSASLGALSRGLIELENQGADLFFGEPDIDLQDWMVCQDGQGIINVLAGQTLSQNPLLYSAFLLWMLSELYEQLPEVGETDKPELVLFLDEAHLIFDNAPKALLQKIEQTVKLIRSKGVSVWFLSQSPADIPDEVLAQLQNKVQHSLHAYTPKEQKAIKAAADGFRAGPGMRVADAITGLKTGQAVVSCLDADGVPGYAEVVTVCPPQSSFDAIPQQQIQSFCRKDPVYRDYKEIMDNPSAYEKMMASKEARKQSLPDTKEKARSVKAEKKQPSALEKSVKKAARSSARSIGRSVGKEITRGLMGNSKSAVSRAAGQFAGNLAADLFGSFFK